MDYPKEELKIRGLAYERRWDWENGYHWFAESSRFGKFLAHYELYKKIVGLPGDLCEFGVFKATSLIRFSIFREMLENEQARSIRGFDAFGSFPREGIELEADQAFINGFENSAGDGLSIEEVEAILEQKGIGNVDLRKGNVFDTVPQLIKELPALRIAFLHLDMDVREPTQFVLDQLFARVVPGGLVVFDDYGTVAGCSEVVDKFVSDHGLTLQKLPFYKVPAFCVKP
ncbi:TylF/MycF/NovP-related O-methyltransferase [Qipengyuania sp. DY56-A-20]|uniref:TylF/MycF/NovP-related O-methyltransferase n=1 Tax=Qipengyuania benthica TaxID=3067651 RepID=A0ABT9HB71_9SPHN|nr:TylF/MycF/NovP-related O-methyltransferase [Qipengyuania sp. DY56-A-20]MDP4540572.1 TylF/MycF/NovP-related O-methyltransferase [Qipengyuania sp. DY56-A-20]